ncbi:MAG TPA: PIG-L family deacetylase [Armatimonadota bacterium]
MIDRGGKLKKALRGRRWLRWLPLAGALAALILLVGQRAMLAHRLYEKNLRTHPRLQRMPLPHAGDKVLIFAPHEDDETLGCGGYIQQATAAGATVHVALMTNGESSKIIRGFYTPVFWLRPESFIQLGYLRQDETLQAVERLGLPRSAVTFLGYPNGPLHRMWLPLHWLPDNPAQSARTRLTSSPFPNSLSPGAVYCGQSMLDDVEKLLLREQPDIIFTLYPNDLDADHRITYEVVRFALSELSARRVAFAQRCRVYTYLVHRGPWPVPMRYRPRQRLVPPAALLSLNHTTWQELPLTWQQTLRKHQTIALYRTQGGTLSSFLSSFARRNELFARLPRRSWPADASVRETTVLDDPRADVLVSALFPHGDITRVALGRRDGRLRVTIDTAGEASPGVTYHVVLHAGGARPEDRMIIQYDWREEKTAGLLFRQGRLQRLAPEALHAGLSKNTAALDADWPLSDRHTFFTVSAWTTGGKRFFDHTGAAMLTLAPAHSAPHPVASFTGVTQTLFNFAGELHGGRYFSTTVDKPEEKPVSR